MKQLVTTIVLVLSLVACGQSQAADPELAGSTATADMKAGAAVLGAQPKALASEQAITEAVQSGTVLLKFGAEWCPPCRKIAPELVALAEERSDITVVDVDTDEHPEVARTYGVQSIPALYMLRDGKVVDSKVGYHPKDALSSWVDQSLR